MIKLEDFKAAVFVQSIAGDLGVKGVARFGMFSPEFARSVGGANVDFISDALVFAPIGGGSGLHFPYTCTGPDMVSSFSIASEVVLEEGKDVSFNVSLSTHPVSHVNVSVVSSMASRVSASPVFFSFDPSNWDSAVSVVVSNF